MSGSEMVATTNPTFLSAFLSDERALDATIDEKLPQLYLNSSRLETTQFNEPKLDSFYTCEINLRYIH